MRIAGLLIVTNQGFAAFTSVISTLVEVDKALAKIAGTVENQSQLVPVLRQSYELMFEAMKTVGLSAEQAGTLVFDLQKAFGDSSQTIRAAFVPALALAIQGEGTQTESIRTLVGLMNTFGQELRTLGTEQEKFASLTDRLIAAANMSSASVDTLREALQYSGAEARAAGINQPAAACGWASKR